MNIELLKAFFMWCTLINFGLLVLSAALIIAAKEWVYKMHSRWFDISRLAFETAIYSFFGLYKCLVFVFCIVPWITLCIIG